jgi:hypothetical protein
MRGSMRESGLCYCILSLSLPPFSKGGVGGIHGGRTKGKRCKIPLSPLLQRGKAECSCLWCEERGIIREQACCGGNEFDNHLMRDAQAICLDSCP